MLHRLSVGNKLNTLLIAALLGVMTISGLHCIPSTSAC